MIVAIMMGRAGSIGMPNKNVRKILGRPMCEYPLIAAKKSKKIDKIYVTTDCPKIKNISKKYKCEIIDRPPYLCSSKALGEDVYKHAYEYVSQRQKNISLFVLLMANAPTVTAHIINRGINILNKKKYFDSAVSVSKYNMWSPLRARKLSKKGELIPFVPFKYFGNEKNLNCDRDSQGNVLFADMSVSVVRPKCLENISDGLLPQKWMGQKIAPILSNAGLDVDFEWQIPQVAFWLKNYYE